MNEKLETAGCQLGMMIMLHLMDNLLIFLILLIQMTHVLRVPTKLLKEIRSRMKKPALALVLATLGKSYKMLN